MTLTQAEMPAHAHSLQTAGGDVAETNDPAGNALTRASVFVYTDSTSTTPMAQAAFLPAGGNLPHNNLMPYVTFYFCIALQGVFPPHP